MPRYYHVTASANLQSILENGLMLEHANGMNPYGLYASVAEEKEEVPERTSNAIFLLTKQDDTQLFVDIIVDLYQSAHIIVVDIDLNKTPYDKDPDDQNSIRVFQNIPKERIALTYLAVRSDSPVEYSLDKNDHEFAIRHPFSVNDGFQGEQRYIDSTDSEESSQSADDMLGTPTNKNKKFKFADNQTSESSSETDSITPAFNKTPAKPKHATKHLFSAGFSTKEIIEKKQSSNQDSAKKSIKRKL